MKFKGQHILSTKQFDKKDLLSLFSEAKKMEKIFKKGSDLLSGKIMASLFFEASTRTRFSFEVAMLKLGGKVVSNFDMQLTSAIKKMETLEDTGKVVSQLVDVVVVRHPEVGAVAKIAEGSDVPVINAGEGALEHPTQGLLDLYTIWKEKGRIDGLTVGLVGDLMYSRVLHSDADLLKFFDVKFVLVSPSELQLPQEMKDGLRKAGRTYIETENLPSVVGEMDVLSCNRLQKERFSNPADCEKFRGSFRVNAALLKKAKKDMIILNPLPRIEELDTEVDKDPRAKYFEQVKNGVVVRMALLKKILIG